jgi:hypothetical protein
MKNHVVRKRKISLLYEIKYINKRCFYSACLRANQRIGPHSEEVISTLVGNLLGDVWGEKRGNSVRFHLHVSSRNVDYLNWLQKFYAERGYCSPKKPKINRQIGPKGRIYFSKKIRTWSFSSFQWLYDLFYGICSDTGKIKKRIPETIESLLTPKALAVWIMDDGGASSAGVTIATHHLEKHQVIKLKQALKNRYGLESTLHSKKNQTQWVLYFPKSQCDRLLTLVEPYIVPTMKYKLRNAPSFSHYSFVN